MTPEMEFFNDGLKDLQKSFAKSLVVLAVQLIDTQANINVLLDIQRDRLVESGRSQTEADDYIQSHRDSHRTAAQNLLTERLAQALEISFDDLDFDGPVQ
jgi:hypothetical protein